MHIVAVTFHIDPAHWQAFLSLMQANATASVQDEPGCHQFDVCIGPDHTVFLYEVYSDPDAFAAHLASKHFQTFNTQTASMIVGRDIGEFTRL